MNGMSCTSIAMMEWGESYINVIIIDVPTGCTLIILLCLAIGLSFLFALLDQYFI